MLTCRKQCALCFLKPALAVSMMVRSCSRGIFSCTALWDKNLASLGGGTPTSRLLSLAGCAAQGIAIVRQLRQLEQRTDRRIHELFDLVCGTSTGGILAVALALKKLTLEDCEQIYRCDLSFTCCNVRWQKHMSSCVQAEL